MTITVALLITIVVLFSAILLLLLVYLGPIFSEFKLIMRDTRRITEVAATRVEKIDSYLDKVIPAYDIAKKASKVINRFRRSNDDD